MFQQSITYIGMETFNKKFYYDDFHNNFYLYMRGGVGALENACWFLGVILLPLGDAISLILTAPLWVIILSFIFLKE